MATKYICLYNLDKPVGLGQMNYRLDVLLVQYLLNAVYKKKPWAAPPTPLLCDGLYSPNLTQWIKSYQTYIKSKGGYSWAVDGIVNPQKSPHWEYPGTFSTISNLNYVFRKYYGSDMHHHIWGAPGMPGELGAALKADDAKEK
jgi:hypothetical protein